MQGSKQLEISDIELQKPTRAALTTAGKQDDDDAPLLGDKRADEGPVDMAPMPFAAWLLLAAAVGAPPCARQSLVALWQHAPDTITSRAAGAWLSLVEQLPILHWRARSSVPNHRPAQCLRRCTM